MVELEQSLPCTLTLLSLAHPRRLVGQGLQMTGAFSLLTEETDQEIRDYWKRVPWSNLIGHVSFYLGKLQKYIYIFFWFWFYSPSRSFHYFELNQSWGGAKMGDPRGKTPDHPQAEFGFSHVTKARLEPTAMRPGGRRKNKLLRITGQWYRAAIWILLQSNHMDSGLTKACSAFAHDMSHDMTKPTKWVCAQRRLRSVWASAQSDQSLRCPHEESLGL